MNRLQELRESHGLQMQEFAAQFGVKPNTYGNYEKGLTEPKISFWKAVADKYHVSIDYLLDFTDNLRGTKYGEDFPTSRLERDLVNAWRSADEKDRRRVALDLGDYGFSYEPQTKEKTAG